MIVKKCTINGIEILLYNEEDFSIPEGLQATNIEETSFLTWPDIPIFYYKDFVWSALTGKKSNDRKLDEFGCRTYRQLEYAYNLIKLKSFNAPRAIRDLIVEKYLKLEDNVE